MTVPAKRALAIPFALLLVFAVMGVTGCGDSGDDGTTTSATESGDAPSGDGSTTTDEDSVDDGTTTSAGAPAGSGEGSGGGGLTPEQEHAAIDIAGAYFVASTDFTRDQFDWKVEAAAQDNDGQWWARVSAAPKDDTSLETEQVYVYNPAGTSFWFAHDMGTGIDPATDESFPEEVRDRL